MRGREEGLLALVVFATPIAAEIFPLKNQHIFFF
jgi:hypothetical protein